VSYDGIKQWDELENVISKTVAEVNNETALVISVIETLNRLADLDNETVVSRNEHGEMYITIGEWRLTRDEEGRWYTTDRIA
jgi:hypothetical protein